MMEFVEQLFNYVAEQVLGGAKIKVGEHEVLGKQGADLLVHPDFRRMGVYNKMNDLYENLVLSYSLSANPIVFNKAIKSGSNSFPRQITQMVRIVDIDKHLEMRESENAFLKKFGFKTLSLFRDTLQKFLKDKIIPSESYEVKSVVEFDFSIDVFWNNIKNHYQFILVRDRDYLNWRYCDPRGGNYQVFIVEKGGEITGYCVLRVNR